MPASKKTEPTGGDAGQAEVQAKVDEADEKGYFGRVPAGPPNEAFSLKSGPDSPTVAEQTPQLVSKYDKES